ncbi:MAG: hypothetical protein ACRCYO_07305 [Bacteroidia bacterium]
MVRIGIGALLLLVSLFQIPKIITVLDGSASTAFKAGYVGGAAALFLLAI